MDEVKKENILRFALNDTIDELHANIVKVLPEIKTEWSINDADDDGKPYYTTQIGHAKIEVHETYANFTLTYKSLKEESKRYESFKKVGKIKKPLKLNIYTTLAKRFDDAENHQFYKRVLRTLNGQLKNQKEGNVRVFREDADSGTPDPNN